MQRSLPHHAVTASPAPLAPSHHAPRLLRQHPLLAFVALLIAICLPNARPALADEIFLNVTRPVNTNVSAWHFRTGVPLPKNHLTNVNNIKLFRGSVEIPVRGEILATWGPSNNSIKWLGLDFTDSISSGTTPQYKLVTNVTGGATPSPAVSVVDNGSSYTVTNGRLELVINKTKFNLFETVKLDGNTRWAAPGSAKRGAYIVQYNSGNPKTYWAESDPTPLVSVELQNAAAAVIRVEGWFVDTTQSATSVSGEPTIDYGSTPLDPRPTNGKAFCRWVTRIYVGANRVDSQDDSGREAAGELCGLMTWYEAKWHLASDTALLNNIHAHVQKIRTNPPKEHNNNLNWNPWIDRYLRLCQEVGATTEYNATLEYLEDWIDSGFAGEVGSSQQGATRQAFFGDEASLVAARFFHTGASNTADAKYCAERIFFRASEGYLNASGYVLNGLDFNGWNAEAWREWVNNMRDGIMAMKAAQTTTLTLADLDVAPANDSRTHFLIRGPRRNTGTAQEMKSVIYHDGTAKSIKVGTEEQDATVTAILRKPDNSIITSKTTVDEAAGFATANITTNQTTYPIGFYSLTHSTTAQFDPIQPTHLPKTWTEFGYPALDVSLMRARAFFWVPSDATSISLTFRPGTFPNSIGLFYMPFAIVYKHDLTEAARVPIGRAYGNQDTPVTVNLNIDPADRGKVWFIQGTDFAILDSQTGLDHQVIAASPNAFLPPGPTYPGDTGSSTAPEIAVSGNGVNIDDGDFTPSTSDHTDFGSVAQGGSAVTRTFTVTNTGTATLNLGSVSLPSGFTAGGDALVSSLAPSASDTFSVTLPTTSAGNFSGNISFSTNDSDENPFNFAIAGTVTAASSGDYFVATNGSDSNPGTESQPFQTIAKALTEAQAGEVIVIRGGTYNQSLTSFPSSGTSWANAITLKNYPSETVTIRPTSGTNVVLINAARSYIVFDGLVFDGDLVSGDAVRFADTSGAHHIRLVNCEVKNATGHGISIEENVDDCEVLDSKVYNTASGGFGLNIKSDNNLIENCDLYNNPDRALLFAVAANFNTVRKCRVYGNGIGLNLYQGTGNLVYNNLIYGNSGNGIHSIAASPGNEIYNNTIFDNNNGIHFSSNASAHTVKNNILWDNAGNDINIAGSNHVIQYNNYLNSSQSGSGHSISNNISSDPLFVSETTPNLHLQSSSPAINAGTTVNDVPDDFDGTSRPQGSAYDMGAYEQ